MTLARLALAGIVLAGCRGTDPQDPVPPVAKGARRFGFHVTAAADNDYGKAFEAARAAGMDMIPLALSWNEVETTAGWNFATLDLVASFFGSQGLPVYFTITSPINTIVSTVPAPFQGLAYDDPRLVEGFEALLDSLHSHLGSLPIRVLILGNEIDATLGGDPAAWARFEVLFEAGLTRAKQLWGPALLVGTTITKDGLETPNVGAAIDRLIAASDIASLTYYPLASDLTVRAPDVAGSDFDHVVERIATRPIYFQEVGYPTSPALTSSEDRQREFAAHVFEAWDRHADRIAYIGWLWLTDLSQQQTDDLLRYYGLTGNPGAARFGEYLRTLGVRRFDGTPKPGYVEVAAELKARGW